MASRYYYELLTRNMALTVILVSLTPLVLISAIIGYRFETSYREKVLAHLKELVLKHEQRVDTFLHDRLCNIAFLANTYSVEELSNDAFLEGLLGKLQSTYGWIFVDLGVVNEEGIQIAYAGPFKLRNADYSKSEWFARAVEVQSYISDVFMGLRHQPHFIVTARQETAGRKWILRATIDSLAFNSLVENIQIGKTGVAFIMSRAGEFQTKPRLGSAPNKEFFIKLLTEWQQHTPPEEVRESTQPPGELHSIGINAESAPSMEAVKPKQVTKGEMNYLGKDFIYVMVPLKNGDWIMAYQQDINDAFSELHQARNLAILILIIGGLSITVVAFVKSKRMVNRIERADQEKEMMNEQVVETGKLASVGELAAGIAHEINNPVAVMIEEAGWMEDLLEEEDLKACENYEEFKRALEMINTQGLRCKEITHKLLSFARKTDPKLREIELNELIEEIVSISEQKARYGNVHINTHLAPDLPGVLVSPSEMQQVLLNLINNAIDAIGPTGGTIDITSRVEGELAVIDVADTGQGIPPSILPRIFDPFFTTKPVGKGTGLGLSICYGIIKKIGGEITINSAVGIGTTFHIHVPLPKKAPRAEGSSGALAQEPA